METIVKRAAALDVHKAQVTACVRVPTGAESGRKRWRSSDDCARLLALRDWLKAHRVTQAAMEASCVYWKPVWAILDRPPQIKPELEKLFGQSRAPGECAES